MFSPVEWPSPKAVPEAPPGAQFTGGPQSRIFSPAHPYTAGMLKQQVLGII